MRTLHVLLPLFVGMMLCACGETQDVAQDEAAVRAFHAEWVRVAQTQDIDAWVGLWDEDAVLMEPNAPAYVGHDGVRAQAQFLNEVTLSDMDVQTEELEVAGDWAFIRQTFKGTWTPKDGSATDYENSKEIMILKRQADNSWRIACYIWNSNDPLPSNVASESDETDEE